MIKDEHPISERIEKINDEQNILLPAQKSCCRKYGAIIVKNDESIPSGMAKRPERG